MGHYDSLLWTWKSHEHRSLVLAKIIPAASQSQPSPIRTRRRDSPKEREMLLLILCGTAPGSYRPWTGFHCVGYYSPVLLLINPSSVFSLLMFPTTHSKQPARSSSSASYNSLDQKRARGGWRKQRWCQGQVISYRKDCRGIHSLLIKNRQQKPDRISHSTAPQN